MFARKILIVSSVSLATILTMVGCGNDSVDAGGACSSSYIQDYNNFVNALDYAKISATTERVGELNAACEKFRNTHANKSCKAMVGGKETTIHSSDVEATCEKVNQALR